MLITKNNINTTVNESNSALDRGDITLPRIAACFPTIGIKT
jgi:hypothetical protein